MIDDDLRVAWRAFESSCAICEHLLGPSWPKEVEALPGVVFGTSRGPSEWVLNRPVLLCPIDVEVVLHSGYYNRDALETVVRGRLSQLAERRAGTWLPARGRTHYAQGPNHSRLHVKVTNESYSESIVLSAIRCGTNPRVDLINSSRSLPARLRPQELLETWFDLRQLGACGDPLDDLELIFDSDTSIRVERNPNVPPAGQPGGGGEYLATYSFREADHELTDVYRLDQVFNEAGRPEITYVTPREGRQLRGSLETKGKHVTLVGPSGIGKSSLAAKTLSASGFSDGDVHTFSGRTHTSATTILEVLGAEFGVAPVASEVLPWLQLYKLIVIDDVHHLTSSARTELARYLKLWHEQNVRFFLIGIARTNEQILAEDPELAIRNDTWHLRAQPDEFMHAVLDQGERALNIRLTDESRATAIAAAQGSPSILQAICRIACVEAEVFSTQADLKSIEINLPLIRSSVVQQYDGYLSSIVSLARGRRQARSVHDTYYAIVEYVARSGKQEISQDELYHNVVGSEGARSKAAKRNSFYRAMKNLPKVIEEKELSDILIFDNGTLTIDDPRFRFYLDHLDFSRVRAQVNIRRVGYEYDVAVSFAGEDRPAVSQLVNELSDRQLEVFYDFDAQAQLWGKDLRKELARVYSQDALFMIVCLSDAYPEKDWSTFELEVGKDAAAKRTEDYLLPVIVGNRRPRIVGLPQTVGHIDLQQRSMSEVADLLVEKIGTLPPIRATGQSDDDG